MMGNVNCLRCRFRHEDNGNCTAVGGFCTAVEAAHCPLLREYLDTGLTPEEVLPKKMADEIAMKLLRLADLESFAPYERLRKLAEADKDGQLVVLPCKVGQRVFALLDTDKHISECEVKQIGMGNKIGFIGLEPIGARGREYGVSLNGFGKTVFLTREEAEKALEAMKDE
nr:MAG TPA: hypothetical protein [Bacteriophage sp.]DAO87723.1 MAG TPA: hypothetical protein [Caudoviricetes sp.]